MSSTRSSKTNSPVKTPRRISDDLSIDPDVEFELEMNKTLGKLIAFHYFEIEMLIFN